MTRNAQKSEHKPESFTDLAATGSMFARGAAALRRAAGAVAGVRRTRRGSFLVLVVGTLALISAFMIVYVAIGRSDQTLSSAVARQEARNDIPDRFGEYAAGIIADDVVATFYPDKDIKIVDPINGNQLPGDPPRLLREATDYPWTDWTRTSVAPKSDAAKYFDPIGTFTLDLTGNLPDSWKPSDPWLASTEPTWLNFQPDAAQWTTTAQAAADELFNRRDWAQISNIAPDGQFVNLFNLRGGAAAFGNFDATHAEMRANLSLFNADGSGVSNQTDFGLAANVTVPAFWTMRQRGAAMPVGAFEIGSPGQSTYRPYQWADADGDGIYDSRWFEMVDPRDPDEGTVNVLGDTGRYRYFFATRIIDLSGLVNVNTAGDFVAEPTGVTDSVAGATPADVDLRRLLTLQDPQFQWSGNSTNPNDWLAGYHRLRSPIGDTLGANYSEYVSQTNLLSPTQIGNRAAIAAELAILRGNVPTDYAVTQYIQSQPSRFGDKDDTAGAKKRAEHYNRIESSVGGLTLTDDDKVGVRNPFGSSDLLELLTYRGINDPSFTSSLESAMGGKYLGETSGDADFYRRFSPLRDNRGLDVEKLTVPQGDFDTRKPEIFAHLASDVRQRLTTLSGARPIAVGEVPVSFDSSTSQFTLEADRLLGAELRTRMTADMSQTFRAYADGLAPNSADPRTWPSNGSFGQYKFLNYGYGSPELSIRMSANLAANLEAMKISTPPTDQPHVITAALNRDMAKQSDTNSLYNDLDNNNKPKPWASRQFPWASWVDGSSRGALDLARLTDNKDDLSADAVNSYGVTPQLFISSAACYYLYVDSPKTDGTDAGEETDDSPTAADESSAKPLKIKGDRDEDNPDYIGQVFAVQLVNPFPQPVTIAGGIQFSPSIANSGDADAAQKFAIWEKTRDRFDYYIEFSGRYYRVAGWDKGDPANAADDGPISITIGPGESRVFYFTGVPLQDMGEKLIDANDPEGTNNDPPGLPTDPENAANKAYVIQNWILTQFEAAGLQGPPTFAERFDPITGDPVTGASEWDIVSEVLTVGPNGNAATNKVVRLWRAVRESYNEDFAESANESPKTPDDPLLASTYKEMPDQNLANDQLVDRLRDPLSTSNSDRGTWGRYLAPGYHQAGSLEGWVYKPSAGEDDPADKKNFNRFSPMTFMFAGAVRRPGDPDATDLGGSGLLPAFCLESAFDSADLQNDSVILEENDDPSAALAALTTSSQNFTKPNAFAHRSLHKDGELSSLNTHSWITRRASGGANAVAIKSSATNPFAWDVAATGSVDFVAQMAASPVGGLSFDAIRPILPGAHASGTYRQADVLLPLAIGPQRAYRINESTSYANPQELDERWLTLGEMYALTLGYEAANSAVVEASDYWSVYSTFGGDTTLSKVVPPFGTVSTAPVWPATDGGRLVLSPKLDDIDAPTGFVQQAFVPFVDVNVNGVFDPASDRRSGLGVPPAVAVVDQFDALPQRSDALTRAREGVVNINTASIEVARLLPMLSPTTETTPAFEWWLDSSGYNSAFDTSIDLAATLGAYRDKSLVRRRPDNVNNTPGSPIAFYDVNAAGVGDVDPNEPDDELNGRVERTYVSAIREQPGFIAAAEVLSASRKIDFDGSGTSVLTTRDKGNFDFLGWDIAGSVVSDSSIIGSRVNAAIKGLGSLDYDDFDDDLRDEYEVYEDKLLVANGMLNAVSTRSDYFAVWFVMHGYKESDVRGLGNTVPMVPSIARRFVMVVDRSSVTQKGQKPRIVLFREVPM